MDTMFSQTTLYRKLKDGSYIYSQGFSCWLQMELQIGKELFKQTKKYQVKFLRDVLEKQKDIKKAKSLKEIKALKDTYLLNVDTLHSSCGKDLR